MLLVIDVGNTNTKVGLCDDAGLRVSWTLTTRREQTADEYGLFIEALLRSSGIAAREVTAGPYRVGMVRPEVAMRQNPVTDVQSGRISGFAGRVDGLVERRKTELEGQLTVVATGGWASLIAGASRTIQHVNGDLKLEGL